jgi:hypothetical protein
LEEKNKERMKGRKERRKEGRRNEERERRREGRQCSTVLCGYMFIIYLNVISYKCSVSCSFQLKSVFETHAFVCLYSFTCFYLLHDM